MHLLQCHFYTFLLYFIKYSDLLQVVFQCKKYSENTVENGTQRKTVIFTADIFAVHIHQFFDGIFPYLQWCFETERK